MLNLQSCGIELMPERARVSGSMASWFALFSLADLFIHA